MQVTQERLAGRIRQMREAAGLTQDDVARELGISRPAVVQLEAGKRKVSSLELVALARMLGRTLADFFEESFEPDGVAQIWRAMPEARSDEDTRRGMERGIAVVNAILELESTLRLERLGPRLPGSAEPLPATRYEAVMQGEELAELERRRLRLGLAPVDDPGAVIGNAGVLVLTIRLPETVSGLTFSSKRALVCAVNANHPPCRQRYSLVHEYCHAVCDLRETRRVVSRQGQRKDFREVRADAFAAAFLMPAEGVRGCLARAGKGRRTRIGATTDVVGVSEAEAVYEPRSPAKSREIDIWDVTRLARYFGTSRVATIWRLYNLKTISAQRRQQLFSDDEKGYAQQLAELIGEDESALHPPKRPRLQHAEQRLFTLAWDAAAADDISRRKFIELAELAGLTEDEIYAIPLAQQAGE